MSITVDYTRRLQAYIQILLNFLMQVRDLNFSQRYDKNASLHVCNDASIGKYLQAFRRRGIRKLPIKGLTLTLKYFDDET